MSAGARYVGFLGEPSGYGAAARGHLVALAQAGHPVTARAVRHGPGGVVDCAVDARRFPDVAALVGPPRDHRAVLVHVPPPLLAAAREPGARNVGVVAWETDVLPPGWASALAWVDEVWVPSAFCAEVFERATPRPVHVVPHPVAAPEASDRHIPGVPDDVFAFVSILEWSDRKNPDGLVRAFCRAFQGRRDVALILKLGFRVGDASRAAALELLGELTGGFGPWRAPPVHVITDVVSPQTIAALHARADAYVSLHRAEGFGLTLAEAMAAGTPVVATGYSGNLEFMDEASAWLVPYRLVPVRQPLVRTWFDARMRWAEPDLDAAVEALRACVDRPAERARRAARGAALVAERLAPARIGERMRARLGG